MSDVPIRSLTVSNFRRLKGTWEFPLDAPVVLIHGSNGAGKTSMLSALELALTGEIMSMKRLSDNYRTHLPTIGESSAQVQVDVSEQFQDGSPSAPLTIEKFHQQGGGSLSSDSAHFYAERCYLDQASLGRLLELYQAREGNEPSALEQFVNELLGLDLLDALRSGLSDARDIRLLKKLAAGVDEADQQAKASAIELEKQTALLAHAQTETGNARQAMHVSIGTPDEVALYGSSDQEVVANLLDRLKDDLTVEAIALAEECHQGLIELGGRIAAFVERPALRRSSETRSALAAATAANAAWTKTAQREIDIWESRAKSIDVDLSTRPSVAVECAAGTVRQALEFGDEAKAQAELVQFELDTVRHEYDALQQQILDAHESSSALIEGLAALRNVIETSNTCPVCDRDFTETQEHSLRSHVDDKLDELTSHGQQLVALQNQRNELRSGIARLEADHARLTAQVLSHEQRTELLERHATLMQLASEAPKIEAAKSEGAELTQTKAHLQEQLEDIESGISEWQHIESELIRHAELLNVKVEPTRDSLDAVHSKLSARVKEELSTLHQKADKQKNLRGAAADLSVAFNREREAEERVKRIEKRKEQWDARLGEARRRREIARRVHDTAAETRVDIVRRVFTESLNEVWRTLFTRLAPNEGFIPRFGIPSTTKKALDIKLETTHRSGETGGAPQMMLSAGNLNTAALSLFLALHLAVQPVVPCLVFDDPVQAMDEVHVTQFAALIRLLAKQNGRQVIIAVHERELFDYLTLELSPAYEGDELITIELGDRAADEEHPRPRRHSWEPDRAIAV